MADEWIKMRCDLADDPAVIAMATTLSCQEPLIVGCLHKLWSWASLHTADGNARGVTGEWVDRFIGITGFADAMVRQEWLWITQEGITFPKFDVHNSESAKKRALTNRRVSKHRQLKRSEGFTGNAGTVAKSVTREEKRREEQSSTAKERVVVPDWVPEEQWESFVAMRRRIGKPVDAETADLLFKKLHELVSQGNPAAEVLEQSRRCNYPDLYPIQRGGANRPGIAWWKSEEGVRQQAEKLGLSARAGESNDAFIGRIHTEIEKRGAAH